MQEGIKKQIVIVGGGFGGVACALELAKKRPSGTDIILISDKPYFEYHAALYLVATGRSEREACVPLAEIFKGKPVEVAEDRIVQVDGAQKKVLGGSGKSYLFDFLVLAVGSETAYFEIPGLKEFSFGLKSIADAIRLKNHISDMVTKCTARSDDEEEDVCRLHFVIVGAGATGVELAGELAQYARIQALSHAIEPSFITIDLIEAASRVLPMFPRDVSERVAERLRQLGVNIFCNRPITAEEAGTLMVRGMTMRTETVIWTAGVKPNLLYQQIAGFSFDKKGRVVVDDHLRARGFENIFVLGDGASTLYSGFAQTAISDGKFIAENVRRSIQNAPLLNYHPRKPSVLLPVGPGWGVALIGPVRFYGFFCWILRRLADFRFFLSILPTSKVMRIFLSKQNICTICGICENPTP
jgi:NADH dehydrogenase